MTWIRTMSGKNANKKKEVKKDKQSFRWTHL